ncbi:MAG: hypothetical protein NDI94_04250 [Candidatus Woesearchaeota archaeon]|nr:hypothetical protein [Candidatus Woesearchaeota archaeon]
MEDLGSVNSFVFSNGKVASTLNELSAHLEMIDDSTFCHHVNPMKNDFANWVGYVLKDDYVKNSLHPIKDKKQLAAAVRMAAEAVAIEMPPDVAPIVEDAKPEADMKASVSSAPHQATEILEPVTPVVKMKEQLAVADVQPAEEKTQPLKKEEQKQQEQVVEIRQIEFKKLGVREVDRLFRKGIPSISNIIFAGKMSTGKTKLALKILIESAKRGENAAYVSLQDTEEKVINLLSKMDEKALDYVNSGHINIKKLDLFSLGAEDGLSQLRYLEEHMPSIIVVDSISSLELSFENRIHYRHFLDGMFKYFEKMGVIAIFLKELEDDKDLNVEFFENILADAIIHFHPWMKVVKYPALV